MKVVYRLLESNQMNKPLIQWNPIDLSLRSQDNQKYRVVLCTALVILLHIFIILRLMHPAIDEIKLAKPLPIEVTLLPAPKKPAEVSAIKAKPIEKPKAKAIPPKPKSVQKPKQVTPVKPVVKPVQADAIAPKVTIPVLQPPPQTTATTSSSNNASSTTSKSSTSSKTEALTEANFRPYYSSNPKPEYPSIARSRHLEGKVMLKVKVSSEGRSEQVTIDRSSGFEMLDNAAVETVQKWRFAPARRGDTPVACTVTIPITFKLQD